VFVGVTTAGRSVVTVAAGAVVMVALFVTSWLETVTGFDRAAVSDKVAVSVRATVGLAVGVNRGNTTVDRGGVGTTVEVSTTGAATFPA
jgi:hypothetical protein